MSIEKIYKIKRIKIMKEIIPKIIFQRSWLYDSQLKRTRKFSVPPKDSIFQKQIKSYEKIWRREGVKILKEISKITKLKWRELEIACYVTWGIVPYSNPLTIGVKSNAPDTRDTLTHELIHRILSHRDNQKFFNKNWKKLMRQYRKYPQVTRMHIVIHAIHGMLLLKFYGFKRLEHEINSVKRRGYLKAWEIAKKDGYKNIVKELTRGIK